MNILIASGTYPPEIGGMATFVKSLAQVLTKKGERVSVVAYGKNNDEEKNPFLIRLVSRRGGILARYIRFFFAVKKSAEQADFIFAQDLASSGLPAALVSRLTGKKLILRLGGDFLWEKMVQKGQTQAIFREYYKRPKSIIEKIYLTIFRFVLGQSSYVIFNNTLLQSVYKEVFSNEVKKSAIIYNPVIKHGSKQVKKEGNIVYAGRFLKLKNLETLIRVFAEIDTSKKLILAGEGPEEEKLKRLTKVLRIGHRVEFLPRMSQAEVMEILAESQLLVLPSLTDFNPNIVMEALAVTAVVVSRETGLPDEIKSVIKQFDPTNKEALKELMIELLDEQKNADYREKLSQIKFDLSWEDAAQMHLEIFGKIL